MQLAYGVVLSDETELIVREGTASKFHPVNLSLLGTLKIDKLFKKVQIMLK